MVWDSGEQHDMENGGHWSPTEPWPGVDQLLHSPEQVGQAECDEPFPVSLQGEPWQLSPVSPVASTMGVNITFSLAELRVSEKSLIWAHATPKGYSETMPGVPPETSRENRGWGHLLCRPFLPSWASHCLLIPQWKRTHIENRLSHLFSLALKANTYCMSQSSGTKNRHMLIFWPRPILALSSPQPRCHPPRPGQVFPGQGRPCMNVQVLCGDLARYRGFKETI